jgi:transposase
VDLHANSFTTCTRRPDGVETFATYRLSAGGLAAFRAALGAEDELAVEATGNSAFFRDQVQGHVRRVVVVAPQQFQVIRRSVKKTDKNDAAALAFFLSKDMLPEARTKDERYQHLHSLCATRAQLVKLKTSLIGKVHGILNRHGIKEKRERLTTQKGLQAALSHGLGPAEQVELSVIAARVDSLDASIKKLEGAMQDAAPELPGYEGLTSIKGIGARSAAVLLSVIGDINDFDGANKLAAYLGIVPRVSQSNETSTSGRITKRGSKLGRSTLVQCTLVAIRYSAYLRTFYDRLKARRGAAKAIIATAKKLLHIVFNTLKYNWVFDDFTTFTKKPLVSRQSS